MANSEKIDNIETFPVSSRKQLSALPEENQEAKPVSKVILKRQLTPVSSMKVEYWHHGEQSDQSSEWKPETGAPRQQNYAKRADQLGLLLLASAVVVVAVVVLILMLNNKSYSFRTSAPTETSAAAVGFYQGNYVFSQKMEEEKALKEGHLVHGISSVTDDLEVSLSDQMSSMSAKMEKMRSEKQLEEPLPATPDKGRKLDMLTRLKAPRTENFESPLEFNGAVPKILQKEK